MNLHLDPADFSPIVKQAIDEAIHRIHAERPRDELGRILLNKREAADSMGVSEATIDRWHTNHGLPCLKLENGKPLFRPEALRDWAAARELENGSLEDGEGRKCGSESE